MKDTKRKHASNRGRVGQRGRLMIPAALQRSTGMTEGTEFVMRETEDGALVLETVEAVKRRLLAAAPPGKGDAAAETREDQAAEEEADARAEALPEATGRADASQEAQEQ